MQPHSQEAEGGWVADAAPDDGRTFRQTLGCFATGVTIVTTLSSEGRYVGLTVNSFSSVSMDPPLVLWSISDRSPSLKAFQECRYFAINVLADDQADLCKVFSTPVIDKFSGTAVSVGVDGIPLIDGAVAQFECERVAAYPGGDHEIVLGRVVRIRRSERVPLLFCKGELRSLAGTAKLKAA